MSRYLVKNDGLFLGSSSACNLVACVKLVKKMGWKDGKTVVTILWGLTSLLLKISILIKFHSCDSGNRHYSKVKIIFASPLADMNFVNSLQFWWATCFYCVLWPNVLQEWRVPTQSGHPRGSTNSGRSAATRESRLETAAYSSGGLPCRMYFQTKRWLKYFDVGHHQNRWFGYYG